MINVDKGGNQNMNEFDFVFEENDEEVYTATIQDGNVVVEKKHLNDPVTLYRHVQDTKIPVMVYDLTCKDNTWTAITDIGEIDIFSEINKTLFKD